MTTPGGRFKTWIDSLAMEWSGRLGLWAATFVLGGLEGLMNILATKGSGQMSSLIDKLNTPAAPAEVKALFKELKSPTGEFSALSLTSLAGRVIGGIKGSLFEYLTRYITYGMSFYPDFYLPDAGEIIDRYRREIIPTKELFYTYMRFHGIHPEQADQILNVSKTLFPSDIVAGAWLRDKGKYAHFWDDVWAIMGLDKNLRQDQLRIELLQEMAYRIPGVQDIIRYVVKEAYAPDVYKAFGQDLEYPAIAEADAGKAGVRPDMLLKEWIAHWVLPSSGQGFDLLHRGEIDEAMLGKLLKALDIMPFWRDKLTALSWDVPNRIELRMLARYGLVDKPYLMEAFKKAGLHEDYRSILSDLVLAQGMLSDLSKRYANKWINSDELKAEIAEAGLDPAIQDKLYKWVVKNAGPDRTLKERDLTASEIIKGVKKGIITWAEGVAQLIELGYDEAEANYKLAINIEVVEEEPTTALTVQVDTIRRKRRQRLITRQQEIDQLLYIGIDTGLAIAYADNDDMRLVK